MTKQWRNPRSTGSSQTKMSYWRFYFVLQLLSFASICSNVALLPKTNLNTWTNDFKPVAAIRGCWSWLKKIPIITALRSTFWILQPYPTTNVKTAKTLKKRGIISCKRHLPHPQNFEKELPPLPCVFPDYLVIWVTAWTREMGGYGAYLALHARLLTIRHVPIRYCWNKCLFHGLVHFGPRWHVFCTLNSELCLLWNFSKILFVCLRPCLKGTATMRSIAVVVGKFSDKKVPTTRQYNLSMTFMLDMLWPGRIL